MKRRESMGLGIRGMGQIQKTANLAEAPAKTDYSVYKLVLNQA